MGSPFESVANAKLVFKIPSGELGEDRYGNPVPQTTDFVVKAVLKPDRSDIRRSKESVGQSGASQLANTWKGYLVEPMVLPPTIKPGMIASAEIGTNLTEVNGQLQPLVEKGEFKLLPVQQSPYLIAAGVTEVTPILGEFVRIN